MSNIYSITVIIPTYNRAPQIANAIESALRQSFPAREVIVAVDGSTDNTVEIVQSFGEKVKLISRPNQGKAATLNNALRHATGEWIAILDDDDTWSIDKLEWQTKTLSTYPECGVCFSNSAYINNSDLAKDSFSNVAFKHANPIGILPDSTHYVINPPHGIFIQSCLIRKDLLQQTGGFDSRMKIADDTDMIFMLSLLTKFCYITHPLTFIDRTPIRASGLTDVRRKKPETFLADQEIMYRKWLGLLKPDDATSKAQLTRRYAEVHNALGNLHAKRNEYHDAFKHFQMAFLTEARLVYRCKGLLAKYFPCLISMYTKSRCI